MHLRRATRSAFIAFAILAVFLIALFYWTVDVLRAPYDMAAHFRMLREQVLVVSARDLAQYFNRSDSLALKHARETMASVDNDMLALPSDVRATVQPSIQALARSLESEIADGGEMAANPDALLEQNEREVSGLLKNFEHYGLAGSARMADALRYRSVVLGMRESLQALAQTRSSAFASAQLTDNAYHQELKALEAGFAQLIKLPLLGIMEVVEDSDDDWLSVRKQKQKVARDQGEIYREELGSLLNRYPREWRFAVRDRQSAQRAQAALQAELKSVEQALEHADQSLLAWREQHSNYATRLFAGLMLAIFAVVALFAWTLRRKVIAPLLQTTKALRTIDHRAGWQLQLADESVAELHELANNLNAYLQAVRTEQWVLQGVKTKAGYAKEARPELADMQLAE